MVKVYPFDVLPDTPVIDSLIFVAPDAKLQVTPAILHIFVLPPTTVELASTAKLVATLKPDDVPDCVHVNVCEFDVVLFISIA